MIYEHPHCWANKQAGLEKDYFPSTLKAFERGKRVHRVIQDHVAGIKLDDRLSHLPNFSCVEVVDYDPNCKIEIPINDKYKVIGYVDGKEGDTTLEIKTSYRYWGKKRFLNSPQRWIYNLGLKSVKKNVLVTCMSRFEKWEEKPPKIIEVDATDEDREKAMQYIKGAIEIIEGNYLYDLTFGLCDDDRCPYGKNCLFK